MQIQEKFYEVNGIELHVVEAGPQEGRVIIFLHGFPEFWYGWRKQLDYFAAKGCRVVAPDQRGYNSSSKPSGVKAYIMEQLTQDIADLIKQVTQEKVVLVGHDWGGAVAWAVAQLYPQLLEKVIILNMPHPKVMMAHLRKNPRQMLRSAYVGFFQFPILPESVSSICNHKLLERSMTGSAKKGTYSEEELSRYKQAWRKPGALKAMINWYRAYKHSSLNVAAGVSVPVLLIWGKKDKFLGSEMAQPSIAKCGNGRLIFLEKATHWLHHEEPEKVNDLIYSFIMQK